ncbi:phosphate/phosphite/phosphonate ABC transporter substrate-binding protein [Pseudorhodobacter sp.]|uniref:phosphate/phosphite/phosphonate ABC transporter substrate-binding protein n=1 Tax=Pseudorhodobacter sp. TaxID=1934400 RepID=UPI002648C328|nr:PhnD/SsuA/transferrin family substrate-binding protein [Pseudorhodobacter sp.]MDN5787327.1 PhnD/SsuA/transferrin family substrate-binding protein [Pseudorhodobacter sp.]
MNADLSMYDFGDLIAANDAWWALIAENLRKRSVDAPEHLTRGQDLWQGWQSPELLLSQTCGFPYRARLHGKVLLVGTPDYGVEGCAPGYYRSVFIARTDDQRGELAAFDGVAIAYNDAMSQSGWAGPQSEAARRAVRLPAGLQTGGHRASVHAVAQGRAEIAAVDAVTWRHLQRLDPEAQAVRVVAMTEPNPGLPLITAIGRDTGALFSAVSQAIEALPHKQKAVLGIKGLVAIPAADYLAIPTPPAPGEPRGADA